MIKATCLSSNSDFYYATFLALSKNYLQSSILKKMVTVKGKKVLGGLISRFLSMKSRMTR